MSQHKMFRLIKNINNSYYVNSWWSILCSILCKRKLNPTMKGDSMANNEIYYFHPAMENNEPLFRATLAGWSQ